MNQEINPDIFRKAAKRLENPEDSTQCCCLAIYRELLEVDYYEGDELYYDLFESYFMPENPDIYWWDFTECDYEARIIALNLTAILAEEYNESE